MIQTWALFVDAYRELNARRTFWVTLGLSALFVGLFGGLGYNADGLTIFGKQLAVPMAHLIYKYVFSLALIGLWAKWGALILALISTASIFPDLLTPGSVDLYLSKPIGRLRLFLTKYATGLIFVLLQTTVIAAGSFLVFGLRAGQWRGSLFLMVPLVGLLFSYLFCICTLLGVLTRSAIASILLTALFWLVCFSVNAAEAGLFQFRAGEIARAAAFDDQADAAEEELRDLAENPSITNVFGVRANRTKVRRDKARASAAEVRESITTVTRFYRFAYAASVVVPKTGDTVALIDRTLFNDEEWVSVQRILEGGDGTAENARPRRRDRRPPRATASTSPADQAEAEEDARDREANRAVDNHARESVIRASRGKSPRWIFGTSLAFEAVILAWAAWVFCRRDY